jgi:hypothetical protein
LTDHLSHYHPSDDHFASFFGQVSTGLFPKDVARLPGDGISMVGSIQHSSCLKHPTIFHPAARNATQLAYRTHNRDHGVSERLDAAFIHMPAAVTTEFHVQPLFAACDVSQPPQLHFWIVKTWKTL